MRNRVGRRNRDIVPRPEVDAQQKLDWASRPTPLPNPAREARPPPGFGRTVVIDKARLLSLDAAMASGFSKHARRTVDGVEPLRITSARISHGIPLELTEDNFLTTRRLRQNHYTPTPIISAPLSSRTYVDPFMNTLSLNLPNAPAPAEEAVFRSPILLSLQSGVPFTQVAEPFSSRTMM